MKSSVDLAEDILRTSFGSLWDVKDVVVRRSPQQNVDREKAVKLLELVPSIINEYRLLERMYHRLQTRVYKDDFDGE
jgi:hypothetical protein